MKLITILFLFIFCQTVNSQVLNYGGIGNASQWQGRNVSPNAPSDGQVMVWNSTSIAWVPGNAGSIPGVGTVTYIGSGVGLLGGPITTTGTLSVDVGTSANKIVQLNVNAQVPAVDGFLLSNLNVSSLHGAQYPALDGSLITNVNAIRIQSVAISSTSPTSNQILTFNNSISQWEARAPASSGTVTSIVASIGLTGGTITSSGTIAVDVGTSANKIVQLSPVAQYPADDGFLITNVNAANKALSNLSSTAANVDINMNTHKLTSVVDPTSAQDAATKNYVDTVASGLQPIQAVYAASTANVVGTYVNGVACVGATFTVTATGALSLDGVSPPAGSRVLLKNQTSGFQNGVYDVTIAGTTGISPVLTRSLDYNTAADMNAGDLIPVINGTANNTTSWLETATISTCGTDSLVFVEWSYNPNVFLLKANNLSDVANTTTSFNNLAPSQTSNSGKFLTTNGTNASWTSDGFTLSNLNAAYLQGVSISTTSPTSAQFLIYNNSLNKWNPEAPMSGVALSSISAAVTTNTIANANNAQVWNWDTLSTETAMKIASSSITSGVLLDLTSSSSSASGGKLLNANITSTNSNATGISVSDASVQTSATGISVSMSGATGDHIGILSSTSSVSDGAIGIKSNMTGGGGNVIALDARSGSGGAAIAGQFVLTGGSNTGEAILASNGGDSSSAAVAKFNMSSATSAGTDVQIVHSGTSGYALDVVGTVSGTRDLVRLRNTVTAANSSGSQVTFSANRTGTADTAVSAIEGRITDITAGAYKGALIFKTANNASPAEVARFDNAGNLGIGTTSPAVILEQTGHYRMDGSSAGYIDFAPAATTTSYSLIWPSAQSSGAQVLRNDGSGNLSWVTSSTGTVTSILASTGLTGGTITSVGTIAVDVGTSANKIIQLNVNAQLPSVDGFLLSNLNVSSLHGVQYPAIDGFLITNLNAVNSLVASTGLTGGTITKSGTIAVDVGVSANKIVQLTVNSQLPAVDSFLLTNINIASKAVSTTAPTSAQILTYNNAIGKWDAETAGASSGTVTSISHTTGLTGGTITTVGTVAVDVGTSANKIVQLTVNSQVPAVDGFLLTNLSAASISGTLATSKGGTGAASLTGAGIFVNGGNSFAGAATIGTNDSNTLGLKTNNSTALTIDTSGNVGIGTGGPAGKLDVNGSICISGSCSASSIAANGYQKFPGGMIIQWGTQASCGSSCNTSVTFPLAFPNNAYSVTFTSTGADVSTGGGIVLSTSTTTFTCDASPGVTSKPAIFWMAIGN